jgi:hypothetical protein
MGAQHNQFMDVKHEKKSCKNQKTSFAASPACTHHCPIRNIMELGMTPFDAAFKTDRRLLLKLAATTALY